MAALKNYKIEYEDGTTQYLQLDGDGVELWKGFVDDKTSLVKALAAGEPEPINKPGK